MSPVSVSTNTVPVAYKPLVAPTVPIVNPPLASVKLTAPNRAAFVPPATVPTSLLVLFSVKVPVPIRPKFPPWMAAVCVTAPGLSSVIDPIVETVLLISMFPFKFVVPSTLRRPFSITLPLVLNIGLLMNSPEPRPLNPEVPFNVMFPSSETIGFD